jgi:hypothetical protein
VREHFPQRRRRLRQTFHELLDAVVERQPSLFRALQHQRRGEELRETVNVEGRVGFRVDQFVEIAISERTLPDGTVRPDEDGRHARDTRLDAKRLEVVAETAMHQVLLRGLCGDAGQRGRDESEDQDNSAHSSGLPGAQP